VGLHRKVLAVDIRKLVEKHTAAFARNGKLELMAKNRAVV